MPLTPYIIVLGNEKGGTGKSTTAMHVMTALLRLGYKVGSIDVDARQGTLSRYIENRKNSSKNYNIELPMPEHYRLERSKIDSVKVSEEEDKAAFEKVFAELKGCDFVVIDTPGHDIYWG